jgi:signal transduction histidine kinase/CheY-like chemotaxis protein
MKGSADAYPFRTLPAPSRFSIAIGLVAIVFLIDQSAGDFIDDGSLFLLLGTAVGATAWFAGSGPALLATVLGSVLGATHDNEGDSGAVALHLALFLVQGLLLTGVVDELRRARRNAEARAHDANAARRESEVANRTKDEFLATISHELRTPLNAVLGWVHLLRSGRLDEPTAVRGLEAIDRNARLQAQLTADLLDVSKALTGKLRLNSHPALLDEAVRQALSAAMPAAKAKGVQLVLTQAEPAVVHGDPTRLRQIAWQLIANAIKFTPRGGTIEVSTQAVKDEALLRVQDSGQGIDPAFLPRVFERFTQADSSATRTAGGLGVGLALVRELVELHGGEIEARNRTDGNGAVFTVKLPLQVAETIQRGEAVAEVSARSAEATPLDGVRVLVFEEDTEGRELMRTMLQHGGADVQTASTVGDALASLESWRPDVLVSDAFSTEHDSYSLIGKVHSLEAHRGGRIPAAALTTAGRTNERLRHLLADVQCEVPKPVEPALLTAEIARLTGRERRRAQR